MHNNSNDEQLSNAKHDKLLVSSILITLFLSGVASVINQSIWQRALKVYLAGSESLSSMIVVFVFMFGLGIGALAMGRYIHKISNPMRCLAIIEIALCIINLLIIGLLSFDVGEGAIWLQNITHSIGIPLSLLYVIISTLILIVPCFLMGCTMPVVSASCQHQLGRNDNSFLNVLFALNTTGAALGCLAGGLLMLPLLGQQLSLFTACILNICAGIIALVLSVSAFKEPIKQNDNIAPISWLSKPRTEEMLSFWLGFFGLAFEMYLFRNAAVNFTPLPYTFSIMLCFYLVLWSIGVAMAKKWDSGFSAAAGATCLLFLISMTIDYFDIVLVYAYISYFIFALPCTGIGLMFGLLMRHVGESWGRDVGRFYGYNTVGSCLGIFFGVMICYQFHYYYFIWIICIGYFTIWIYYHNKLNWGQNEKSSANSGYLAACILLIVGIAMHIKPMLDTINDTSKDHYFSSQGVVVVDTESKNMYWDGLWHSKLSNGSDHIDTRNWMLATIPLCAHEPQQDLECLVIGLGTGITAATLARTNAVKSVDIYEINPKLKEMIANYPKGTLGVGTNPKVQIKWRDARIGLALSDKKYDLITQQPLYLKQAGSSMLLSKEYMTLIKNHLKDNGVFCIYSNTMGDQDQAMVVRKTAATVFPHVKSFINSYMIVASKKSFSYNQDQTQAVYDLLPDTDIVKQEMLQIGPRMWTVVDREKPWDLSPVIISDDQPIIEYPALASWLVKRYQKELDEK